MNWRKVIAGIIGFLTFIGVIVLIGIVVQNIWPGYSFSDHPLERLSLLFICFMIASMVYNLIKGEEPEVKEKQGITSKEISKMLAEKREKSENNGEIRKNSI